jgi:Transposase family tnp2
MALESLIKSWRNILLYFDELQFKDFPTSLYVAKKRLNIFQLKMQLVVCTKCHKLHNVKDIIAYKDEGKVTVMNCLHKEFPNNSRSHQCNNSLSGLKKNKDATIAVPRMLYPKPSIRQQLSMLYQRPGFEDMLKLAGAQRAGSDIYSDIYDGRVWKTFSSSSSDGSIFFRTETATTHLGFLINLDWFQPFAYTQHSTGAIYASICNLPRSERNKPENTIYLGFLPGPKEVGLEKINHYLAPIVDEFLDLWKGWRIPKTYEHPDGLDIKGALIIGSSDTPATRKLFGHASAVMKCYRCEKRSTYSNEYSKTHYGGMEDYDEWVTRPADALLHREYAQEWMECNSRKTREDHFKEHGVRWTELLRLPYMDPI